MQKRQVGGISGVGKLNSILSNSISFDNKIYAGAQGEQAVGGAIARINGNSVMRDCVCLENEMGCTMAWAKVLGGLVGTCQGTPSITHSIYDGSLGNGEGDDWHGTPHTGRFVGRNATGGEKEQFCSNCVKVQWYLNHTSGTIRNPT